MRQKKYIIIDVPTWYGAGKMGTELAPDAFRKFCLADKLRTKGIKIAGESVALSEDIKGENSKENHYEEEIYYTQKNVFRGVAGCLFLGYFPLVIGGPHEISIGSVTAQTTSAGGANKLGIIWIDAHLDAHTPETSPFGNIHGMPLRVLLGEGSERLKGIGGQFDRKAYPRNVVHIGANSWELAEIEFFAKHKIPFFPKTEIDTTEGFARMCAAITDLSARVEVVAVSIDADAFHKTIAPGVHLQNENGISEEMAYALARHIRTCPNIGGIDVAEVVPGNDSEGKTVQFMYNFLSELLAP